MKKIILSLLFVMSLLIPLPSAYAAINSVWIHESTIEDLGIVATLQGLKLSDTVIILRMLPGDTVNPDYDRDVTQLFMLFRMGKLAGGNDNGVCVKQDSETGGITEMKITRSEGCD